MNERDKALLEAIEAVQAAELETRLAAPEIGSLVVTVARAMMIGRHKGLFAAARIIAELRKEEA